MVKEQALSGLKVIDLTWHIAGPYCTKLLADLGADVIKIEQPRSGDPTRREGPFPGDEPDPEASGLFVYLNNNKKGITLNLKSEQGKRILETLVADADIVVENFSPDFLKKLGLDYESLKSINPRLIMTSITNFGQTGKYKDYPATDMISQAMGGFLSSIGVPEREPLRAGGNTRLLEYIAGTFAGMSTLSAVLGRRKSGEGQHIDVSITETALLQRSYQTVQNSFPTAPAKHTIRYPMLPSIEKCRDGYVGISILTGQHWQDFCMMTEMYDWMEDERFTMLFNRLKNKKIFQERLDAWLIERTQKEVLELGKEWRIPVTPVLTFEDLLSFPQFVERDFFTKVEHPKLGEFIQPGAPFRLTDTPWMIKTPAPMLGQDNQSIYKERLGISEENLSKMYEENVI